MGLIKKNQEYAVNVMTMIIKPMHDEDQLCSRIIQQDGEFLSPFKPSNVIKMNCLDNGSSFEGTVSGSRHLLGGYQKVPVMICSENQIYFFPTASPEHADCIWINPLHIQHYKKFDKKTTLVIFKNNQSMKIPVSLYTFHNQYQRTLSLMNLKNQKTRENKGNMSYLNQNNAGMSECVSDQGIFLNYGNFS